MDRDRLSYIRTVGRHLLVFFAIVAIGSGNARGQVQQEVQLERIREAFRDLDYEQVEDLSADAIAEHEQWTPDQLAEVHVLLGLVQYYRGSEEAARASFVSALSLDGTLEIDPLLAPPQALAFFEDLGLGQAVLVDAGPRTAFVDAGADLVVFSGDKLLGGPQAGILAGRRAIIKQLKQHPLARAMRADKLCYAALSATLDHYRRDEATEKIPVWRMIAASLDDLQARLLRWQHRTNGQIISGYSTVGGGSLPGTTLKTALLALAPPSPDRVAYALRMAATPVITRISDGQVLLDPRTVLPEQDDLLLTTLERVLSESA